MKPAGLSFSSWSRLRWPLAALTLLLLANALFTPGFFHLELKEGRLYGSVIDVLNRAAPVMLLSLGMTLVIATGGVDLSVGALMAVAGALGVRLLQSGAPAGVAMAGALGGALLAGCWNGALVAWLRVPPIVATLIFMVSGRGMAQLLTGGQILTFENSALEYLSRGRVAGIPFAVVLVLILFLLLHLLTRRTAIGLFIEAAGDNETASIYAGVNTRLVKLFAYASSAVCAGVAGLVVTADIKAADPNNAGLYLELDAILATVIGGTPLTGGRISFGGSIIGAVLMQTLTTTILTRGIPPTYTLVVKSAVILVVCLLQAPRFRQLIFRRRQLV